MPQRGALGIGSAAHGSHRVIEIESVRDDHLSLTVPVNGPIVPCAFVIDLFEREFPKLI
jgi:hypothetical protein